MTAEEIRRQLVDSDNDNVRRAFTNIYVREVAAQLAELNNNISLMTHQLADLRRELQPALSKFQKGIFG